MCTKFELVKKGMLGTLDIMLKENLKFVIKRRGVNHASLLSCSHVTASGIKRHYAAFVECVVVKRERERKWVHLMCIGGQVPGQECQELSCSKLLVLKTLLHFTQN